MPDKSRLFAVVDDAPTARRLKVVKSKSAVAAKDVMGADADAPEFRLAKVAKARPRKYRDHLGLDAQLREERADIGFGTSDVSGEIRAVRDARSGRRAEPQQDLAKTKHRAGTVEIHPQRFPSAATVCLDKKRSTVAFAP